MSSPSYLGAVMSLILESHFKISTDFNYSIQFSNYIQPVNSYTKRLLKLKLALIPIAFYVLIVSFADFIIVSILQKN